MMPKAFGSCQLGTYSYLSGINGTKVLKEISNFVVKNNLLTVVDLETSGKIPTLNKILLVSFTFDGKHSYVFSPESLDFSPFLELLASVPIANHFIKFDYAFIKYNWNIDINIAWDTYVTHAIATPGLSQYIGSNSLENLSSRYLNLKMDKSIRKSFLKKDWLNDETISYAALDSLATYNLIPITEKILDASCQRHIWETIEKPLIYVLVDMELSGVDVDLNSIISLRDQYQEKCDSIIEKIKQETSTTINKEVTCPICKNGAKKKLTCQNCFGKGKLLVPEEKFLNLNSPSQVISYFKDRGIDVPTKERSPGKSSYSVDKSSLSKIDHPLARLIESYRDLSKDLTAFLIPWSLPCDVEEKGKYNPQTRKIHPETTQCETRTGRMSQKEPNLQQVPKLEEFRKLFIAPKGCKFIIADYSQYELRVLADLSQDENLLKMFKDRDVMVEELNKKCIEKTGWIYTPETGEKYPELKALHDKISKDYDIHSLTAIKVFKIDSGKVDYDSPEWKKKRSSAKAISFGIPYGSGPATVASRSNGAMTYEEAVESIKSYFNTFKNVERYINRVKTEVFMTDNRELASILGIEELKLCWSCSLGNRRRYYPIPTNPEKFLIAEVQRAAVNHTIQGTNADVTKTALIMLHKELLKYGPESKIRLVVHDEIVSSVPEGSAIDLAFTQVNIMKEASNKFVKSVSPEVGVTISPYWTI